jgi:hypothetical protein
VTAPPLFEEISAFSVAVVVETLTGVEEAEIVGIVAAILPVVND